MPLFKKISNKKAHGKITGFLKFKTHKI